MRLALASDLMATPEWSRHIAGFLVALQRRAIQLLADRHALDSLPAEAHFDARRILTTILDTALAPATEALRA